MAEAKETSSETLLDWAYYYIKNKDVLIRSITNIEKRTNQLFVMHKNKTQLYFIKEHFTSEISGAETTASATTMQQILEQIQAAKADATQFFVIVVYNTKENLDYLVKKWNDFAESPNLSIIFANPASKTDKRWIIFPFTHQRVTEKNSLEAGLKALFETVEQFESSFSNA